MSNLTLFIISSIAVFRLSELFCFDDGPGGIFKRLRGCFPPGTFIGDLLACQYCSSVHLAFFAALYLAGIEEIHWKHFLLFWWGIAGGSIVVFRALRPRG